MCIRDSFFSLRHLSVTNKYFKLSLVTFLIPTAFVMFVTSKQAPYNDNFTIGGNFAHFYYKNRTSTVSFYPNSGPNAIPHLLSKVKGIQSSQKYKRGISNAPAVFIQKDNDTLPEFIADWPVVDVTKDENDILEINIPFNYQKADKLFIIVKCDDPKQKCVESIDGFDRIERLSDNSTLVRLAPIGPDALIKMQTKGPFSVDVIFHWYRHSKLYNKFVSQFPSYVIDFAKNLFISDTCLVDTFKF